MTTSWLEPSSSRASASTLPSLLSCSEATDVSATPVLGWLPAALIERAQFARQRTPALLDAIQIIRGLPHALEKAGYRAATGHGALCVPGTVLLSAYPPGAHYERHLDCYGDDNARALTIILYANAPDWDGGRDGGALRAELCDGRAVEVAPAGGRIVVFDSRRVWHAVLPASRLRFALTLWVYADVGGRDHASAAAPAARRMDGLGSEARPKSATGAALPPLAVLVTDPATRRTAFVWR